ncbi:MAG: homocysteine S-methyltransferase family protein [Chloroflexi bacterium]|nr:homocysteine S-methyltransferase family protein [Chloroflexota bacterium]MCH8910857.1 homocysteine S-methyltransferase family protein [Chloroflexota bacterium]
MAASDQHPGILDRLAAGDTLIFDGATGTYLQQHGLEPGGSPELMNANDPDVVRGMAKTYFDAGSDIVLTNSFGGNRFMLAKYGAAERLFELNRLAAEHARSAAPPGKYVAGSIGPTGEFIEPLGDVTEDELYDTFAEMSKAFEAGGADAVMVETQLGLEEAAIAVRAAKENTGLVAMATMVFDKGPRGYFTMFGVTPEQAVEGLQEAGADIVGTNCGSGIERMVEIATRMRAVTDGYLVVQSNAGLPEIRQGEICYPETPEFMAEHYRKLAELPINILGGCCGTTAEHIRALVQSVKGEPTLV